MSYGVSRDVGIGGYRINEPFGYGVGRNLTQVVLRWILAAILFTAAGPKAHQLATMPSLGAGFPNVRWFNIFVVEFELFSGVWLIFGMLPKLT